MSVKKLENKNLHVQHISASPENRESTSSVKERPKRPDKALYVPRALREVKPKMCESKNTVVKKRTEPSDALFKSKNNERHNNNHAKHVEKANKEENLSVTNVHGNMCDVFHEEVGSSQTFTTDNDYNANTICATLDSDCANHATSSNSRTTLETRQQLEVNDCENDGSEKIQNHRPDTNLENEVIGDLISFDNNDQELSCSLTQNYAQTKEIESYCGAYKVQSIPDNCTECSDKKNESNMSNNGTEMNKVLPIKTVNSETCDSSNSVNSSVEKCDISYQSESPLLFNYPVSPETSATEKTTDSWDTMFTEDGECLKPQILIDLCGNTQDLKVDAEKNTTSDFSRTSSSDTENIVELYDFPMEFNTQDLVSALNFFQKESYTIKWVDDCHALAIFNTSSLADQAIQLKHPFVKFRPLFEGIPESKAKARLCARMAEAHKPRPATSATLARRLVSGALGLRVRRTKEQRDTEEKLLREAKERKKLKAKQKQDIWDGIVS